MSEKNLLAQTIDERDRLITEYIEADKTRREAEREYRSITERTDRLFNEATRAQMAVWVLDGRSPANDTAGRANQAVRERANEIKREQSR